MRLFLQRRVPALQAQRDRRRYSVAISVCWAPLPECGAFPVQDSPPVNLMHQELCKQFRMWRLAPAWIYSIPALLGRSNQDEFESIVRCQPLSAVPLAASLIIVQFLFSSGQPAE